MNKFTVTVSEDKNGDFILPLPEAMLDELGWKVDDTLDWNVSSDGTITLSKLETELVMVETVHQTVVKYVVEVPKGKKDWALDTVAMEEAFEFSSNSIGFNITSHRVITEADAIAQYKEDNKEYPQLWHSDAVIIMNNITPLNRENT
jgi:hypothetical protein